MPVDRLCDIAFSDLRAASASRLLPSQRSAAAACRLKPPPRLGRIALPRPVRYRPHAMEPVRGYPAELETLEVFSVWSTLSPLSDRFDPFSFPQRMAAYRMLIEATNRRGRFGDDNRRNPLWGLVFQHQWQFSSGRLGARTSQDGTIDPDAPWGFGNYALCVIPWLAAASTGLVPDVPVRPAARPTRFDYGADPFRAGIDDWRAFFTATGTDDPGNDEPVRLALWKAHKTCLDVVAQRLATIDPGSDSHAELAFLRLADRFRLHRQARPRCSARPHSRRPDSAG
jgi:Leg1